ncbi:SRPBCC family protein [Sutcliffiella halmapala]
MPVINHQIFIKASIEDCFDLARNVDVHTKTTGRTKERAVSGVTSGLLEEGDKVTWEAVHFGVKQKLTARITELQRPFLFVDVMVKGAFHSFTHTHTFEEMKGGTVMSDRFVYKAPLGPLGRVADFLFLETYMQKFIEERAHALKVIAEQK